MGVLRQLGFIIGTGLTLAERRANLENLRTLAANCNSSTPLELPAGDIEFELDETCDQRPTMPGNGIKVIGLYIDEDFDIIGKGRNVTRLQVYPRTAPQTFTHYFIWINGYSEPRTVAFRDLSIVGSDVDPGDADVTRVQTIAVKHQGKSGADVRDETLRFERVDITGHWHYALESNEGNLLTDCVDSVFHGVEATFGYYATTNTNKRLHMRGCTIYSYGEEGDQFTAGLYINPCISGRFVDCDFRGYTAYGLYWNTSSTIQVAPQYQIVDSCWFNPSTSALVKPSRGIQGMTHGDCMLQVCNTHFNVASRAIEVFGNAAISNCTFNTTNADSTIFGRQSNSGATLTDKTIAISNCNFLSSASGSSAVVACTQNGTWVISNCNFKLTDKSRCLSTANATDVTVTGCTFDGVANAVGVSHGGTGTLRLLGNTFLGALKGFQWTASQSSSDRAILVDNDFQTTGRPLNVQDIDHTGIIRGRNNRMPNVMTSLLQVNACTQRYQRLGIRQAINDSTVASGSSLVLDPNYDTHHVTGTAAISKIYFITSGNTGNTRVFEGTVRLIADGAWCTASGGNIKPRSTAARTVDTVITLVYDPRTAYWYEI